MVNDKTEKQAAVKKTTWWNVIGLAWELGYTIAIPIVVLGFGGAYVDKRLGISPLFILTGIALAMALTGFGIYRKIKKIII